MNETNTTSGGSKSYTAQRILAGLGALPLTVYALMVLVSALRRGFDPLGAIFGLGPGVLAILGWWFALRGHIAGSRVRMRITVKGGLIVGGLGFAAGFFGPIILTPSANQGPLLGIFFTGPLGFVVGAVIGWLYARSRARASR